MVEHLQQVLPISTGLHQSQTSIIHHCNTDIDFLSTHLPTPPPIAPGLNVDVVSVATEMTVACEIPLNLPAIKLTLTFLDSNLTVDQIEGPVKGAVDFLQHPSPTLTGSCFLQIFIFSL